MIKACHALFVIEIVQCRIWGALSHDLNVSFSPYVTCGATLSLQLLFSLLFADDTSVFIQGDQLDDIGNKMNIELNKLVAWLNANKLSLNIDKTQYMIFRTSNRKLIKPTKLEINDNAIKQVSSTTFLGVTIDNKLNWAEHINKVKCKISKGVGIINKAGGAGHSIHCMYTTKAAGGV